MRDDDDPEPLDPDDPRLDADRPGRGSRGGGTPLARPPGAAGASGDRTRRGGRAKPGEPPPLPVEDRPSRRLLPKLTLSPRRRTLLVIAATAIVTYWVVDACEGGGSGNGSSPVPTVTVTVTVPAGQGGPVGDATSGTSRGGAGTATGAPGGTTSTPRPPAPATPAVSFTGRLTLDVRQFSSVNLDGEPPVVQRSIFDSDLTLATSGGGLLLQQQKGQVAPVPSGTAPSYAACRDQTTSNARPELPVRTGTVVCVQSGARRVGYLRTVSVTGTTAVFDAMLWQPS